MSGIYIPGMEPPKPDEVIHIYNNAEARKCPLFEQKVIEVSVAIPVSPHGRLIDADALRAWFVEWYDPKAELEINHFLEILDGEDSAPTIIPADPAKEGEGWTT